MERKLTIPEYVLTPEEKWRRATIANNFIFYKVMRNNPAVCKELLEILLEMKIESIEMHQEDEIDIDYDRKGIRLDLYAKNSSQSFDIEMQVADTGELPERARYYQGAMDLDDLKSGQKYKELKDSYIIFICLEDIFGKGLAKYTFENLCREDTGIKLMDRAKKLFFICKNCDKMLNEEQKAFLKLVTNNEATNTFTGQVSRLVEDAKHNTQWRIQYMNWERQRTYDFDAGKEEGARQTSVEVARKLLQEKIAAETVAKCTGLSLEEVTEIKESLAKQ